jgi:hypothetical protein
VITELVREVESDTGGMRRTALLSKDFRFRLGREWRLYPDDQPRHALWIMLNPSTADALVDDATIRRCVSFSQREGCGSMQVLNRFPLRSRDPGALVDFKDHPDFKVVTEFNRGLLAAELMLARQHDWLVICAWGAHSAYAESPSAIENLVLRPPPLWCLGTTKQGHPKHPLYLAADTPLEPFGEAHGID